MTLPFPAADMPEAKARLLIEAERAFAEHGIANASLREISERAGHRNRSAAQYHFGSRDGLVLALLRLRRPQVDAIRSRFFASLDTDVESATSVSLIEAIVGPLLFSDLRTRLQPYARTVYALLQYDIDGSIWRQTGDAAPLTQTIYAALRRRAGSMDDAEWRLRQTAFGRCSVDLAAHRETMFPAGALSDPSFAGKVIDMLHAMLLTPAPAHGDGMPIRTNCAIWRKIGRFGDLVI